MWLEMINIRIARVTEAAKLIELCICSQGFQSLADEKLLKVTVYCSSNYATDFSIHLEWDSDPGPCSVLGRALSEALGDLGLLSHTVWMKKEEFSKRILENLKLDRRAQKPRTRREQYVLNLSHTIMILAHDLRGLLFSLAAGLDLLVRGTFGKVDERIADRLKRLHSQAVRLNGIAEDYLLGTTFDESGEIRKEALDLRKGIIDPVLEEFADLILSGRIRIDNGEGTVSAGTVTVHASGKLLRSVYRNLFSNVVRYGGKGCLVSFGCEDQGQHYRLNISNSGEPVPEKLRNKLFTMFGCIGGTGGNAAAGTGLGLYLVREILLRHGGDIWYEANQEGSIFVFTIPKEKEG